MVACDSSAPQLQHAAQRPNLRYLQAPAEALPPEVVPSGSVDLATCAQAFHWWDGRGRVGVQVGDGGWVCKLEMVPLP